MRGRRARDYEGDPELTVRPGGAAELRAINAELGPLFDRPVPFQRGSDTSEAAAAAMEGERVNRLRASVFEAYVKAGASGLTADQAAAAIGESILAVRPRCTELLQAGLLEKVAERRRNDSGLMARVLRRTGQP